MANAQSTVEVLIKAVGFNKVQREANKTTKALQKNKEAFSAVSKAAQDIKASVEKSQGSFAKGSKIQGVFSARVLNTEKAMRAQIRALREVQRTVKFNGALYQKAGAEIARYEAVLRSANSTASKTVSTNKSLGASLGGIATGFIAARTAQQTLQAGIRRDESERRLRLLTQAFGETEQAQEAAQRAAERFNLSQTEANVQLSRLIARLRPMGLSMQTIETAFAGFNTATILAGATASESAGAFLQLSQALGSGVLRGQELNSILEQAPLIAQAIATEMGTTVGALKKFGEEGQITSQIVIAALGRVEREGAGQLTEALKGPAAAIKDFQNATQDVQVALTQDIMPQLSESFRGLAELIVNLEGPIKFIGELASNTLNQINSLIVQATKPAAAAARRDIEAGLIPTNIIAGLTGGDVRGGAKQLFGEAELKDLENRAREFSKLRGTGFQETLLQFMQDRLATMDTAQGGGPSTIKPPSFLQPPPGTDPKGKERVDMTQKLLDLNNRLRAEKEAENEREIATLELMVRRQEIAESNLTPIKKENELQEAISNFRMKIFGIDKRIAEQREKDQADAAKAFQDQIEQQEKLRQAQLEADPGFKMKQQLEELLDVQNQVAAGATAIGNAFSNSLKAVVTGSKSADQALADMMASVAEHFLDMAAKIIAQQLAMILYGTIMKALGVSMGGGGAQASNLDSQSLFNTDLGLPAMGDLPSDFKFAQGGYVSGPTNALIGEGGEPEYVIPESKMRESMARYSRGARGGSVIPESGEGGTTGEGAGAAVAAPIDVRFNVERINNVDYVTAEQFQVGLARAAQQGAAEGERRAMGSLRNSAAVRRRIGV